jgi:hypothetical protein
MALTLTVDGSVIGDKDQRHLDWQAVVLLNGVIGDHLSSDCDGSAWRTRADCGSLGAAERAHKRRWPASAVLPILSVVDMWIGTGISIVISSTSSFTEYTDTLPSPGLRGYIFH